VREKNERGKRVREERKRKEEGEREGEGKGRDDPPTYFAMLAALTSGYSAVKTAP